MVRGRLRTLLVALLAAGAGAAGAPVPATAAQTVTIAEPLEAQPFVADLGHVEATAGDDGRLTVRTQIVARPPAGWGGCIALPNGVCVRADMLVTWYLDHRPGGSPMGRGADWKVWARPIWGQTSWMLEEWSDARGHWIGSFQRPLATTDAGGATWSLPLAALRLAPGERLLLRASSRFVPLDDAGQPLPPLFDDTETVEVPLPATVASPPPSPAAPAPDAAPGTLPPAQRAACVRAQARVGALRRRIRRAARAAQRGPAARRRAARRELRRLRVKRDAALGVKRRTCAKASQPPSRRSPSP